MTKPTEWNEELTIKKIVLDPRLQVRAGSELNEKHVERMRLNIRELPRVHVFRLGKDQLIVGDALTRGFHRIEAFRREGMLTIPAVVHAGTFGDALLDAAAGNRDNGLPMEDKDNRKAAYMLFESRKKKLIEWQTDTALAAVLGVNRTYVSKLRRDWEGTSTPPRSSQKRKPAPTAPSAAHTTDAPDDEDDSADDPDPGDCDRPQSRSQGVPAPSLERGAANAAKIVQAMAKDSPAEQDQRRATAKAAALQKLQEGRQAVEGAAQALEHVTRYLGIAGLLEPHQEALQTALEGLGTFLEAVGGVQKELG